MKIRIIFILDSAI